MIWTAVRAVLRGLVMAGLSVVGLVAALLHGVVLLLSISLGLIFLGPWAVGLARWVTNTRRKLAARWDSVYIPSPYRPAPSPPQPDAEGLFVSDNTLYKSPRIPAFHNRLTWMLDDVATWRDLSWLLLNATVGNLLALTPTVAIVLGALNLPWGAPLIIAGFAVAPAAMRLHVMGSQLLLRPPPGDPARGFTKYLQVWGHTMGIFGAMSLLSLAQLVVHLLALLSGALFPYAVEKGRRFTNLRREVSGRWTGVSIARPYLPRAPGTSRWKWVVTDRATWRDLCFFVLDPIVSVALTILPAAWVIYAGWGLAMPQTWRWFVSDKDRDWGGGWYGQIAGSDWLAIPAAVAMTVAALWMAPHLLRLNGRWTRLLLAPTKQATLALRVHELTVTRTETTDAQAAELRRIERDLHDGAQARLVAMGLGLGALERLIDSDPAAAKTMLAKVRDNSAKALVELRDLVRGIHPPVLADRGLGDAVRALALDTPMPVKVHVNLPHRLDPSVESAAYFAISEALTNTTKHAHANAASVEVALDDQTLTMTVWDDGRGGADASRGTGLRGIERRLSAFDGALTVHSPVGGPTTVQMTLRVGVSAG